MSGRERVQQSAITDCAHSITWQQREGKGETERLGGSEIDDQLHLRRSRVGYTRLAVHGEPPAQSKALASKTPPVPTSYALAQRPSRDQIDRARPGLVEVALRHPQIDRKVGAARKRHEVIDDKAPTPIFFGQPIDADPAPEPAAVEYNTTVGERRKIDLAAHNIGVER